MCNQKKMQSLIQRFLQLSETDQNHILKLVREKIQRYQIEKIKSGFDIGFTVPGSKNNHDQ
jgi:hypothetical protein